MKTQTFRKTNVTTTVSNLQFPDWVKHVGFHNAGSQAVAINFTDEGSNFVTIDANTWLPFTVRIQSGETFKIKTASGTTILEAIGWS